MSNRSEAKTAYDEALDAGTGKINLYAGPEASAASNGSMERDLTDRPNANGSFLSMIDQVEQMRRWSSVKSGDVRVMNSEMQLIRTVGYHDGINVGSAAKELGITKGAVSQTLGRLEKKGLICKEQDPVNASRLRLHLTDRGLEIHKAHERYHEELKALEEELLSEADEKSRAFLERYLTVICGKLNQEYEILSEYLG